jgi:hypothetical protein
MIVCYSSVRNKPYGETHLSHYTPLTKLPDAAILEAGNKRFSGASEAAVFADPGKVDSALETLNNS